MAERQVRRRKPERLCNVPYLAFDLGAESGRAVLGRLHAGVLTSEEVYRFPNEPVRDGTSLRWDVRRLWQEVCASFSRVNEPELTGIGVDAWGVDYALLGDDGQLLQNPVAGDRGQPQVNDWSMKD